MSRRATREARLVRGLLVAVWGAGLATTGHVLAGGGVPTQPAVLLLVLLAAAACTALSDREWSFGRLLVALGGVELLVHLAMAASHGAMPALGASGARPSGWTMLGAHAIAALLSAWGLRYGEALYWRVLDHLNRRPLPRVRAGVVVGTLPLLAYRKPITPTSVLHLRDTLSRRGPPALVA
jgi:hypothetical protein